MDGVSYQTLWLRCLDEWTRRGRRVTCTTGCWTTKHGTLRQCARPYQTRDRIEGWWRGVTAGRNLTAMVGVDIQPPGQG